MDISSKKSAPGLFSQVVDRMLGLELQPVVPDRRMHNLMEKRMHIRAVGVREGFLAMRARSDEMAQRLELFKKQRNRADAQETSIDPVEPFETIVLQSK
ncbi:MAG TPA: hypothetical protein VFB32_06230 [Rudaea sp.]|nr:hypothetical protein [Rudaea sp.]